MFHAVFHWAVQSLAVVFLGLTGCSSPPAPDLNAWLPEGMYHFRCDVVNQNNLARVSHVGGRMRVDLLGDFEGGFSFAPEADRGLRIVDARMDYEGLKRSFKGEGRVLSGGVAEGEAILWLKSMGPVSRNHRDGPWTLRPASPREVERHQVKQRQLEERRKRAREAGLAL